MEAQRYPDDFDGLVAGAPAYDFTNIAGGVRQEHQGGLPHARQRADAGRHRRQSCAHRTSGARRVRRRGRCARQRHRCANDTCRFSLAAVKACPNDTEARRLPDRRAAKSHRSDLRARNRWHEADLSGPARGRRARSETGGGNGSRASTRDCWRAPTDRRRACRWPSRPEVFKYMVFANPNWDYTTYDLAHWARDTKAVAPILNADNPDLSASEGASRKVDPLARVGGSGAECRQHDRLLHTRQTARLRRRTTFTRLYLLPGVVHCNGGRGPDRVEWLTALATGSSTARRRNAWSARKSARIASRCEHVPSARIRNAPSTRGREAPTTSTTSSASEHGLRATGSGLQASGSGSAHATITVPAGPLAQW